MSENKINDEIKKAEQEKIDNVKKSLENLDAKKSKFLFFVPESINPSASVYEIYFHANVVKRMGYDVKIMTEKENMIGPKWIEKELVDLEHIAMSSSKLTVSAEDFLIIPEVFSNVMEQTKSLPCTRVGLLQSIDYMVNSLVPGTDWKSFGINDVITTSKSLKEVFETFYGSKKFNVKSYDLSVPDYFEGDGRPQKPVISVIGRNPNEVSKLVKMFFSKYPQYSWVSFDPMVTKSKPPQPMRRKDFAERLKGNFAAIWIDRISSYGTFPLECMKAGVLPICLQPDITPEYLLERDEDGNPTKLKENSGIWVDNFYDLPTFAGEALIKFLDDNIPEEIYTGMKKIADEYTPKKSESQLVDVYSEIVSGRRKTFASIVGEIIEEIEE